VSINKGKKEKKGVKATSDRMVEQPERIPNKRAQRSSEKTRGGEIQTPKTKKKGKSPK